VASPIQGTRNQPAYGLVGLLANYDVNNHVKLALHINNLFDKNYYSGIGQYNTVYYGSPRNVMATMKYTF
jgi:outer membrane receptor for ferric coprogen and ferric-rhodotorulic acid